MKKISLQIGDMTCVNCSNAVSRAVGKMDGISVANVSFATNEGIFVYDENKTSQEQIEAKIEKIGYKILKKKENSDESKKLFIKVVSAAFLTIFLHIAEHLHLPPFVSNMLIFLSASIVQFWAGSQFYAHSFKALKNKTFDMNVLVALGASAAYFYSLFTLLMPNLFPENLRFVYFDGAAMIIVFVLFGRFLENRAKTKAADFMKELLSLMPKNTLVIRDGKETEVLQKELKIGDIIVVKSGQIIASDSIVIEGEGEIDAAIISGESMLRFVKKGDQVIGGTTLKLGFLKLKVEKLYQDTTLFEIIKILREVGGAKVPIARIANKISSIFVPLVIALSILTFIVWAILGNMQMAILCSISVLIVSCPCALGLATPIAIVAGVGRGAKEGIFIKNPEVLEIIGKIKIAVFDKTGTLTHGKIHVGKSSINDKEALSFLASLEVKSEHPISYAICNFAKSKGARDDLEIENLEIKMGLGIVGYYKKKQIAAGTAKLYDKLKIDLPPDILHQYQNGLRNGKTTIIASIDRKIAGLFYLEDEIKNGAYELVEFLKSQNIEPYILTGDKKEPAQFIANQIGIKNVISEVLPQDKFKKIKEFQKNSLVLFVGDGINDSLSISQADIGIAMNSGSDIAKKSGDIIIMNNALLSIKKSIELSRSTLAVIKQNLFWAFFYNILGIPLAAGVFYFAGLSLTPAIAGAAMSLSSVIVVLNSLRLRVKKL